LEFKNFKKEGMKMMRKIVGFSAALILFFVFCSVSEAKSLKKGEVYSLIDGRETIEVISGSELEITESGKTILAEYDFKGDKLRVVANVMGTKMVKYYLLTKEGLKDEKTGEIYYSKAALAEEQRKQRFTDNGNGTVTHNLTKLMWQKENDNTKRNWDDAITYCEGLSLGGYDDWRLPNIEELKSIIDERNNPAINTTSFPNTKPSYYWSSTTNAYGTTDAWFVNFYGGSVYYYGKSGNGYVRCVRAGQ
jgi:hypothetical protein